MKKPPLLLLKEKSGAIKNYFPHDFLNVYLLDFVTAIIIMIIAWDFSFTFNVGT